MNTNDKKCSTCGGVTFAEGTASFVCKCDCHNPPVEDKRELFTKEDLMDAAIKSNEMQKETYDKAQNQDWVKTLRSRHNPYNAYHWGSVIDEIAPLISSLLLETEQRVKRELAEELKECPPHNMVDFNYTGMWGGITPPPNKKCTKCLMETRF